MNKTLTIALFSIASFCGTLQLSASDATIQFFLYKYPYFKLPKTASLDKEKYSKKLQQPDYIVRKMTKPLSSFQRGVSGVFCFYGGTITISSFLGQVTFPRLQQKNDIYVLVTTGILPAYMIAPSTVHNWIIDTSKVSQMFHLTLKHDPASQLFYYEATEAELPKNNNIPLNTIIIIAEPSTVFIPMGATIVDNSPNMILPTIYIKKEFCFVYNALYSLALKQYFRQNNYSIKQDGNSILQIEQVATTAS